MKKRNMNMERKNIMRKNKKGWIKLIEAFIATMFLLGVIAVIVQSDKFRNDDYSVVEERATKIIRGIEIDDALRAEVIAVGTAVESGEGGFPDGVKTFLDNHNLQLGECVLKICPAGTDCLMSEDIDNEIFSKDVLITATKDIYDPKTLKVFCWAE
ncbi:MAG: hypothetical protein PF542_02930 [Nanoarchaeota archaeon]|jgi:hypothetical protein|nr:hypothetical protein [Nanoarchaeota archaeon]